MKTSSHIESKFPLFKVEEINNIQHPILKETRSAVLLYTFTSISSSGFSFCSSDSASSYIFSALSTICLALNLFMLDISGLPDRLFKIFTLL